ncbi:MULTISPECIES: APC family permease [unclassified Haloferax]|uniref:APC family permease n=1 Tax=Haloferax sp. Atlit-48N TaxID=2077198 RepID=A0ACD5HTZ5_9EURY|nr:MULTISPECIES: APC family permease [unclassified Haloferax]RDZ31182.1 amino acid permease [Haloferax sp. Atlit-48N]RDZ35241.1 amino acid permease [Haloferax sp. Atlit-24N]RLM35652.1 APC family permease [Haloferax sp. Atlit-109R]RLM43500.1 APC family permease [Haloferax sp. Atlit-105R]
MDNSNKLGWIAGFAVAIGLNIGGGLWTTPIIAASVTGPVTIALTLLATIPIILAAPAYISLSKIWPISPGHYYYPTRMLVPENRSVSKFIGWTIIWAQIAIAGFVLVQVLVIAGASYLNQLIPAVPVSVFTISLLLGTVTVVWFGLRAVGRIEVLMAAILLVSMGIILLSGIPHMDVDNYTPFIPTGASPILSSFGLMFGTVLGSISLIDLSGEIKNPEKTFGQLLISSTGVTAVISALIVFVSIGIVPYSDLQNRTLRFVTSQYLPPEVLILSTIGAALAGVTSVIGIVAITNRHVSAASNDGILPKIISKNNAHGEPAYVLIFIAITSIAGSLLNIPIYDMVSGGTLAILGPPILVCLTGFRLPSTYPEIFERKEFKNKAYLHPAIVRWSSLAAALCLIAMYVNVAVQNSTGAMWYGLFLSTGIVIFALRVLYQRTQTDTNLKTGPTPEFLSED